MYGDVSPPQYTFLSVLFEGLIVGNLPRQCHNIYIPFCITFHVNTTIQVTIYLLFCTTCHVNATIYATKMVCHNICHNIPSFLDYLPCQCQNEPSFLYYWKDGRWEPSMAYVFKYGGHWRTHRGNHKVFRNNCLQNIPSAQNRLYRCSTGLIVHQDGVPEAMATTCDALRFHLRRVHFQAMIWINTHCPTHEIPELNAAS